MIMEPMADILLEMQKSEIQKQIDTLNGLYVIPDSDFKNIVKELQAIKTFNNLDHDYYVVLVKKVENYKQKVFDIYLSLLDKQLVLLRKEMKTFLEDSERDISNIKDIVIGKIKRHTHIENLIENLRVCRNIDYRIHSVGQNEMEIELKFIELLEKS